MPIVASDYSQTKHTGLKIHNDNITYLFDIRIDGKRHRRIWVANSSHTKTDRLKTAYTQLEVFRKEIEKKNQITADIDATVNDYWENLKSVKQWNDYRLMKHVQFYNKYIFNTLGMKRIKDIKPSMLTEFNKTLTHLSKRSQKIAYELLVPLFNLAIEDEIIDRTPIKSAHIPIRKQLEEKKIITDAVTKYRAVHTAIHEKFKDNAHHRALFLFGFYGRRLGEVVQLQWDDIDFNNNTYRVKAKTSKVNTDMVFDLPSDVREALIELKDNHGDIFSVKHVEKHYKSIRDITGISEFTFHWMRNLAVSALSSMGMEAIHLSSMLGHTDTTTVNKYLSLQREASTKSTNNMAKKLLNGNQ